jgi:hypothetical protein
MSRPRQGIAQRLNAAQLAIVNSLSDLEIQGLVGSFGYTTAKLEAGRALYEAAQTAVNAGAAAAIPNMEMIQETGETKKEAPKSA